jgi:hypothetical protein
MEDLFFFSVSWRGGIVHIHPVRVPGFEGKIWNLKFYVGEKNPYLLTTIMTGVLGLGVLDHLRLLKPLPVTAAALP